MVNFDQSLKIAQLTLEESKIIKAFVLEKLRAWPALDTGTAFQRQLELLVI